MSNERAEDSIAIERGFFDDQLARIRDLSELKIALHLMYLSSMRGKAAIPLADLFDPAIVQSVVGAGSAEPAVDRMRGGLERALADGLLLRLTVREQGVEKVYVLVSNRRNRDLLDRLRQGDGEAERELELPPGVEGSVYRPNIFALYERHIGPLTPLVADQLREAERAYPKQWLEQAIMEAVHYNKRNWRYVESVLTTWEESREPDEIARRYS
jgi:DNA replication protein